MKKSELTILMRAFAAEIEAALNGGIPLLQSRSKVAQDLCEDGYLADVEWIVSERPRVTVDGYALTHLGRMTYCATCPDHGEQGVTE